MSPLSTHKKILLALFIILLFALAAFIYVKYSNQSVIQSGELTQERKEELVAQLNSRPVLHFLTEQEKAALVKSFTKK